MFEKYAGLYRKCLLVSEINKTKLSKLYDKVLLLSLNNLQNTKQDNLLLTFPLLKDISNNITIYLSAYSLKINVDASLNDLENTKQKILREKYTTCARAVTGTVTNNVLS
jgi:hypothetical protein